MKILALETSGITGSVALWNGDSASAPFELPLAPDQRSARSLAPTIRSAIAEAGWKPAEIELVAVTSGPGSFTSLRVGVVTAKTFAYAVRCPVVGVNTLEVIARQAVANGRQEVITAMDAQRSELFVARFQCDAFTGAIPTIELEPTHLLATEVWLQELKPGECVTGPGLKLLRERLANHVEVVAEDRWQPMAASVGKCGLDLFKNSKDQCAFDPFLLVPQYFRRTAAEEQWEKRRASANATTE